MGYVEAMGWRDDTIFKRLLRNAGLLLGGKAANALLSLGALAITARALGPQGLGALVLLHGLVQVVAELAKFQSWQGVVRFGAAELNGGAAARELPRLLSFSLLLDGAAILAGLGFLEALGPLLARRLDWPAEVAALLPLYATVVVGLVPGTASGVLRLYDRFDLLAAQSACGNAVRLMGAGVAWGLDGGLAAFALVWWGAAMVAGLLPFVLAPRELARRHLRCHFRWPSGIRARHPGILRFFLLTSANAVIALAPSHLAVLVVGSLLGAAPAGLFRVAKQIADAAAKPAEFLAQALYPEAARLDAGGRRACLRQMLSRLAVVTSGLAAAAIAFIFVFGSGLIALVAGQAFVAAAPVMNLLVVAAALVMAAAPLEPILIAIGAAGQVVAVKAVIAVLHLLLLLALARQWGLEGVGWAALAAALLSFALLWLMARQRLRR
ncbi:MAG: lipopolysaccharide biosynthesis protein [Rhodospirillaceae bacterium]|nr:lipopolysaccharide biosynthesis protein [Rhodospirillales bacterium]